MAWPWLGMLIKTVPWVELARRTPDIIAASGKLLEKSRAANRAPAETPREDELSLPALHQRIQTLEARDEEHARVIAQMVEQLQGLTDGVEVLAARNRLLIWAVVALAALLVLLVLVSAP